MFTNLMLNPYLTNLLKNPVGRLNPPVWWIKYDKIPGSSMHHPDSHDSASHLLQQSDGLLPHTGKSTGLGAVFSKRKLWRF